MSLVQCLAVPLLLITSAPKAEPQMELRIDGKEIALANLRLQSATTTSGRPTFVVMGDLGGETVFIRATLTSAKPGEQTLRVFPQRSKSPVASLNIDSRPESGVPLLRPSGGTLTVSSIATNELEHIVKLALHFKGKMLLVRGPNHEVELSLRWDSTDP